MARFSGLIGIAAIMLSAWLFSTKRSAIEKRVVLWGVILQFSFAFIVLKTPFGQVFYYFSQFVNALLNFSSAGASFVFGDKLGLRDGGFARRRQPSHPDARIGGGLGGRHSVRR